MNECCDDQRDGKISINIILWSPQFVEEYFLFLRKGGLGSYGYIF